ncbi:hypothetical protein BaRGS_00014790 [Batillaria attramentaria]|uniref:Uncharacterized protein n=1 Tax=Batillaria attramentaria TaxID=370345 RepID=A0ABD0L3V2_9CAEN
MQNEVFAVGLPDSARISHPIHFPTLTETCGLKHVKAPQQTISLLGNYLHKQTLGQRDNPSILTARHDCHEPQWEAGKFVTRQH